VPLASSPGALSAVSVEDEPEVWGRARAARGPPGPPAPTGTRPLGLRTLWGGGGGGVGRAAPRPRGSSGLAAATRAWGARGAALGPAPRRSVPAPPRALTWRRRQICAHRAAPRPATPPARRAPLLTPAPAPSPSPPRPHQACISQEELDELEAVEDWVATMAEIEESETAFLIDLALE
jgi:hypothetical protein